MCFGLLWNVILKYLPMWHRLFFPSAVTTYLFPFLEIIRPDVLSLWPLKGVCFDLQRSEKLPCFLVIQIAFLQTSFYIFPPSKAQLKLPHSHPALGLRSDTLTFNTLCFPKWNMEFEWRNGSRRHGCGKGSFSWTHGAQTGYYSVTSCQ